ncbi:hypothetical protein N7449_007469 [Penicillium cf. viridicatum]|uniref:Uncharacterized protein n=1 Tax=Penicillium cf. viridicatum TaxID=2972119 RepID=A0A9W9MC42_9EURO|nr:hypothetical protein N7449_007469 [Penicillium cf. viridicatum]
MSNGYLCFYHIFTRVIEVVRDDWGERQGSLQIRMRGFPRQELQANPNNNPSLAGTPQKAAHCLGFENSTVDEGGFGDSAVASHETVDLGGYKSLER